jgi:hypothetical protein
MLSMIKTAALSAFIGLGALAAAPATAQADGLYLNFGNGGSGFGFYAGDRHDGYRHHRRHYNRDRCTAGRALDKAERMGLRRTRIVDAGRHTIKVRGRKFGSRVTVVFANERGCPIIYR